MDNTKPAIVHTVTYRHEYGTDTSVYATAELAWAGACRIITNWLKDVESHQDYEELIDFLNDGNHQEAVQLWSEIVAEMDICEELTIEENREVITEVVVPIVRYSDSEEECVADTRCDGCDGKCQ